MSSPESRRIRRRICLPGYPSAVVFQTPEDVYSYFSTVKIICLECGKRYRTLGNHLINIHSMTHDDYRNRHGIPWLRGLCGTENKQKHSEAISETWARGALVARKDIRHVNAIKHRVPTPMRIVLSNRNLVKMNYGKRVHNR